MQRQGDGVFVKHALAVDVGGGGGVVEETVGRLKSSDQASARRCRAEAGGGQA